MENFKEIAEKCLAGELRGTFKLASGESVSSYNLERLTDKLQSPIYQYQMCVNGMAFLYTIYGTLFKHKSYSLDIIDFIPDNMQKQIKIDIPEGKVLVVKQTENGAVITWKEKELTYKDIVDEQTETKTHIGIFSYNMLPTNPEIHSFYKKVEVLRKLTNIRNYFGKDNPTNQWTLTIDSALNIYPVLRHYRETNRVYFATQEHAEQAIKMLGNELKYLFEPW